MVVSFRKMIIAVGVAIVNCIAIASAEDALQVDADVLQAQSRRTDVMKRAASATIAIFGLDGGGGGSGVIITPDGYALTNYHVSSACGDHMRCGLDDGKIVDAVIVGVDATGDVSLIKLLGRDDFPTAPLADSDTVRVGQWCFSAGNPFVLATNLQPSVSLGIVSGVHRYQYPAGTLLEYADCIQTDAAVNPGNSGGPLFNLDGQVIGINGRCSFEKRGRVNVGVGYAISANQIKLFMGMLRSGRLVDHATLGATVSTADSGTIEVSNILSSSDAYRRGLRYGDEIVSLADREVHTTNAFKNVLGTLPKGWRVPIEVRRDGEVSTVLARLDGVHTEKQLVDLVSAELVPGHQPPDQQDKPGQGEDDAGEAEETDQIDDDLSEQHRMLRPNVKLVESIFEPRVGFANYYFNRINRDRVWDNFRQHGDLSKSASQWTLTGRLAGEPTKVAIQLAPQAARLSIGRRSIDVEFNDQLSEVIAARRESGLLVALRALQELMQVGPGELGDTVYIGVAPIYSAASTRLFEQPQHDILQTLWHDVRARFAVDPASGMLSLIEVFGDLGNDPVEVYADKYKEFDSGEQSFFFPSRIRLQYGTEPMLLIQIESILADDKTVEKENVTEGQGGTSDE